MWNPAQEVAAAVTGFGGWVGDRIESAQESVETVAETLASGAADSARSLYGGVGSGIAELGEGGGEALEQAGRGVRGAAMLYPLAAVLAVMGGLFVLKRL